MKIFGYSERGIIDSIIYSLNKDKMKLMINFLLNKNDGEIEDDIEILLENSLSDFGDPDLIIIFKNRQGKNAIFIEAKVKTFSSKWTIEKEYDKYNTGNVKSITSNLFRQLGLKKELVNNMNKVKEGLRIKNDKIRGKKQIKKIGNNQIVNKTFDKIKDAKNYYFIGIIPDTEENIKLFEKSQKEQYIKLISWRKIENFIKTNKIENAIMNFEYNRGQIY